MDTAYSVSVAELRPLLGTPAYPTIFDVRRTAAFDADPRMLAGALRCEPDKLADWQPPSGITDNFIITYCVHGHEVSQNAAALLRSRGFRSYYLDAGIAGWSDAAAPTMRKRPDLGIPGTTPSKWITRERPKIDRIACPWLIRRFIDPQAEFHYVPSSHVLAMAKQIGAVPYDIPGVDFSHAGDLCSFDAFLACFDITDPHLAELAAIVRGADTGKPELTPQSAGLLAVSLGLSVNFGDDRALLAQGMVVYDALYAWLRTARREAHNADLFRKVVA